MVGRPPKKKLQKPEAVPQDEHVLLEQELTFINQYFALGFNARRAAIKAGYSPFSADQVAWQLLNRTRVAAEIRRRFGEQGMTEKEVLARLAAQARGDIADLLDDAGNFDYAKARDNGATSIIKKFKRTKKTLEVGEGEGVVIEDKIEFELYDAQSALEKILKVINPQVQKVDVTSNGKEIAQLSDADLKVLLAQLVPQK